MAQFSALPTYSILKETMRGGGGNITESHAEEVSLCARFLMGAAKKVDRAFDVHRSTVHTVRDADKDILKLTSILLETKVASENSNRNSPPFSDPTESGHKKLGTTSWLADTLATTSLEDLQMEISDEQLVELNYEIADITS